MTSSKHTSRAASIKTAQTLSIIELRLLAILGNTEKAESAAQLYPLANTLEELDAYGTAISKLQKEAAPELMIRIQRLKDVISALTDEEGKYILINPQHEERENLLKILAGSPAVKDAMVLARLRQNKGESITALAKKGSQITRLSRDPKGRMH